MYPFYNLDKYLAKGDLAKNFLIWFFIGIIVYFIVEVLIYRAETNHYPLPMFLFFTGVLLWPGYYSKKADNLFSLFFDEQGNKTEMIIVFGDNLEEVYKNYFKKIFSPCNLSAASLYGSVGLAGMISTYYLISRHMPFKAGFITFKVYFGVLFLFFISGMSINIIYMSIKLLRDISKSTICLEKIQYGYPDRLIRELRKYYFEFSITTSFVYFGILIMVIVSPFGFDPILVGWLIVLAIAPVSLYGSTIYFLDKIVYNIRLKQIDFINQNLFSKNTSVTVPDYKTVVEYFDLRNKIVSVQPYLSGVNSFIPLAVSVLSLLTQVVAIVVTVIRK